MRKKVILTLAAILCAGLTIWLLCSKSLFPVRKIDQIDQSATFLDATRPIDKRVNDLISHMTLEEKAAQLCGLAPPTKG